MNLYHTFFLIAYSFVVKLEASFAFSQRGQAKRQQLWLASPTANEKLFTRLDLATSVVATGGQFALNHEDKGHLQFLKYVEEKERTLARKVHRAQDRVQAYQTSLEALQSKKEAYLSQSSPNEFDSCKEESRRRSVLKSLVWRLVAGSVTFATTLHFLESVKAALQVAGASFCSTSFATFIGEQQHLMNRFQASGNGGSGNVGRSLAKTLVWRLVAFFNTLTMAMLVAKNLSMASKIATTDAILNAGFRFVHERAWARLHYRGIAYQADSESPRRTLRTKTPSRAASDLGERLSLGIKLLSSSVLGTAPVYAANTTALDVGL